MRWLFDRLSFGLIYLGIAGGMGIVRLAPRRVVFACAEALANLGFHLFRGFRRRSVENLGLALGDRLDAGERARTVRRSLQNFFRDFVEIGYSLSRRREEPGLEISVTGREHLQSALAKGNGVIALSAHLGNFFLVGTRLAMDGCPTHVLINPPRNEKLRDLLVQYRLRAGKRTIHARPQRQAFYELLRVLKRNEVAVVIADEFRSGKGVHVPFFNHTVAARRGPATLALRSGAALVPLYLVRGPNQRLELIIEPEIKLSRSGRIQEDIRENTVRVTRWLERVVRTYPDQWNWMNIRWQRPTAGEGVIREDRRERVA